MSSKYPIFDLEAAIHLAKFAHSGQQDYSGQDYFLHPLIVMRSVPNATETEKMAAVLHDVVEDTKVSMGMLASLGCPPDVLEIVRLISRDKSDGKTYAQWIDSIATSGNVSAIKVKIADMTHNMSPERTKYLPPEKKGVTERYKKGIVVLMNALEQLEKKDGNSGVDTEKVQ